RRDRLLTARTGHTWCPSRTLSTRRTWRRRALTTRRPRRTLRTKPRSPRARLTLGRGALSGRRFARRHLHREHGVPVRPIIAVVTRRAVDLQASLELLRVDRLHHLQHLARGVLGLLLVAVETPLRSGALAEIAATATPCRADMHR